MSNNINYEIDSAAFCGVRVLVVVPAYNEEHNIEKVIKSLSGYSYDVLVVNDGSTDNTKKVLQELGVRHVNLINNLGIGGAVQTGYLYALQNDYDIAVQFDGDGQHDAAYIQDIIAPIIRNEADLVVGSRFMGNENSFKSTLARRVGIKLLSGVLKVACGSTVKDITSGFRAVNRTVLETFAVDYPSDYPEPESLAYIKSKGYRVFEVPVVMHERTAGQSSIQGLKSIYYMIKVSIAILMHVTIHKRGIK